MFVILRKLTDDLFTLEVVPAALQATTQHTETKNSLGKISGPFDFFKWSKIIRKCKITNMSEINEKYL